MVASFQREDVHVASTPQLTTVVGVPRFVGGCCLMKAVFVVDGRVVGYGQPAAGIGIAWARGHLVALSYSLYRADDPMCCPSAGEAIVRYQWNGGRMEHLDPLPPDALYAIAVSAR